MELPSKLFDWTVLEAFHAGKSTRSMGSVTFLDDGPEGRDLVRGGDDHERELNLREEFDLERVVGKTPPASKNDASKVTVVLLSPAAVMNLISLDLSQYFGAIEWGQCDRHYDDAFSQ